MKIRALLGVGLILVAGSPVSAQGRGIVGPRPSPLHISSIPQDTAAHHAVVYNWQEPALIGGAVTGAIGELFGFGFCTESESHPNDKCVIAGEGGFLILGGMGGLIAGLIGSSSHESVAPKGFVQHGDRRVFGALALGVPSFAINAWGMTWYCRQTNTTPSGCTAGNVVTALLTSGFNAWIGSLLGKAIPAYQEK